MIDITRPIHVTERSIYRSCRRKWYYQFIERLKVKQENEQSDALFLGSGGHKALEMWYDAKRKGENDFDLICVWSQYVEESGVAMSQSDFDIMAGILDNYAQYSNVHDEKWKIVEIEKRFTIELPGTDVKLTGAFDLVIQDGRGGLWIVDHKFLSRMPDEKHLEMDDQMTAYIWIARQVGLPIRGVIYNVIKKKVPAVPLILKNGTLSKNKMQDTTYELYLQAIEDNNLDRKDYEDMLEFLANKENNFIQRFEVTRNQHELNGFYDLLMMEIAEMSNPSTFIYPNPGYACQWCSYQVLCKAESEQGDTKLIKEQLYRKKETHER